MWVTFRIICGLGFVLAAVMLGVFGRHSLVVLPLGVIFLFGYIGGKWPQWRPHFKEASGVILLRDLGGSFLVQLILAGLLYWLGRGIGFLVSLPPQAALTSIDYSVLAALLAVSTVITIALIKAEISAVSHVSCLPMTEAMSEASNEATPGLPLPAYDEDADIVMSSQPISPETFFRSRHYSVQDYTRIALTRWPREDGAKIIREPEAASEAMLSEAETRLGFALPDALRALYRIRNGGSLPSYWVPATENPGSSFDDWIDAFAYDYDDLKALKDLELLQDIYMEHFDPDYDDVSETEDWYPGSEKIIVLAKRYGVTTALDYRQDVKNPGVLLLDLDNPKAMTRKSYLSFDAFFADLRQEDPRFLHGRPAVHDLDRFVLSEEGYSLARPDRFWGNSTSNAPRGITDHDWDAAQAKLGLTLPEVFKQLYKALDGGVCAYPFHPALGYDDDGAPRSPIPGELYSVDNLLQISQWSHLKALSARIEFKDAKPFDALYENADKLIVISASYDAALMLDGRQGDAARVLYTPNLMRPEAAVDLGTAPEFLAALRGRKKGYVTDGPMTDDRLSPRTSSPETFWMPSADEESVSLPDVSLQGVSLPDVSLKGVSPEALEAAGERFGKDVPDTLAAMMTQQNGGAVRFRFMWGIGSLTGQFGQARNDPSVTTWTSLFPGGIWPLERWLSFSDWRAEQAHAKDQNIRETLMPEMMTEPDVTERLIVIGANDVGAITLLDMSEGAFKRTPYLLRADYDAADDLYKLRIAPISISHYSQGVFACLRAKLTEL